jgi:glycosyltransferase involved in cell wall biosynthesis
VHTCVSPGERCRPAQAFLLGWPLANLGGVNEVVRNLVREFSQSGDLAPVVIEAMDGSGESSSEDGTPVFRIPIPMIYDARAPVRTFLRFCLVAPFFFRRLGAICRQHDVRVLNPHFVGIEHLTLILFRWLGCFRGHIALSFHGSDIRGMIQSRGLERFLVRMLLRGADVLIPCSQGLGKEILLIAPECADRIEPVPNGIDIERFLEDAATPIKLPPSFERRRRILTIGAFEYKKGHDVLLKAFAQVKQAQPDTCLIIAGQTRSELDATRQLIHELQLDGDVLLLRDLPHPEVAALLQTADLFALSSRWQQGVCGEGFAMVLLEAAAAQKPVVSTRSCGVTELVRDGETGLLVEPDNPEQLAQALLEMLNHPQEAERQGKSLHSTVRQHFTWKAAHQRYLTLVLEHPPTARTASPSAARHVDLHPVYIRQTIHTRTGEDIAHRYPTLFYPEEAMDQRTIRIFSALHQPFDAYAAEYVLYSVEGHEEIGRWRMWQANGEEAVKAAWEPFCGVDKVSLPPAGHRAAVELIQ